MIPQDAQRTAYRRQTEGRIAAWPAACRFRGLELQVFAAAPRKSRNVREGGTEAITDLTAEIALPLDAKRPQPEKELIEIRDQGGDFLTYAIETVEPLRGRDCYLLGLRSRNKKPGRAAPAGPFY